MNSNTDEEQLAWKEHELSQLRYFRSLPLRDKILALEQLQVTFEQLQKMRAERSRKVPRESPLGTGDGKEESE